MVKNASPPNKTNIEQLEIEAFSLLKKLFLLKYKKNFPKNKIFAIKSCYVVWDTPTPPTHHNHYGTDLTKDVGGATEIVLPSLSNLHRTHPSDNIRKRRRKNKTHKISLYYILFCLRRLIIQRFIIYISYKFPAPISTQISSVTYTDVLYATLSEY